MSADFTSASKSGPLDPLFLYADNLRLYQIPPYQPLSEAQRHRLVKASKSPTSPETEFSNAFFRFRASFDMLRNQHCIAEPNPPSFHEHQPRKTPLNQVGCKAVIEHREWSDEYRFRTEVEATSGREPPAQSGTRTSFMLTDRGARKIADSCHYMGLKKDGFKTFVTGTFSEAARDRISRGETTIQKEVTRTMDALNKMYQRGWNTADGNRIAGHSDPLAYCWVVEIPKNSQGQDNPHVHVLLGWEAEYAHFGAWSDRIEGIWGNGYFHLEKIKDCMCAGAYMAKAAGYLTKAQGKDDQGKVRGNRYGISSTARAPGWARLGEGQLHLMGQLIADVYDHLSVKFGEKFRQRKKLKQTLDKLPKHFTKTRQKVGQTLQAVRSELDSLPIRCNRYQVILKGSAAAARFMGWATNADDDPGTDWLPEKPAGMAWIEGRTPGPRDTQFFARLYRRFELRKFWRRLANPPAWLKWIDKEWHQAKEQYENYRVHISDPAEPGIAWADYYALEHGPAG
jgi:hypothetical protein